MAALDDMDDLANVVSKLQDLNIGEKQQVTVPPAKYRIPKKKKNPAATAAVDKENSAVGLNVPLEVQSSDKSAASSSPEAPPPAPPVGGLHPLRPYQAELVHRARQAIDECRGGEGKDRGILVYLPTGGGKTRVATELILDEVQAEGQVLFVVNRDTLAAQALGIFYKTEALDGRVRAFSLKDDVSGDESSTGGLVTVATVQSLSRRLGVAWSAATPTEKNNNGEQDGQQNKVDPGGAAEAHATEAGEAAQREGRASTLGMSSEDAALASLSPALLPSASLIIIDEAHCAMAPTYRNLMQAYPEATILGLTATPFRLDPEEELSMVFHKSLAGPNVKVRSLPHHIKF